MEERKQQSYINQTPPWKWHRKLMSTTIASKMLQLLGLPTLLYQLEVHTNLKVTILYTQVNVMGLLFVTTKMEIKHYGFSNQAFIDSEES